MDFEQNVEQRLPSCLFGPIFDPLAQDFVSKESMGWGHNAWREVLLEKGVTSHPDSIQQPHGQRVHAVKFVKHLADLLEKHAVLGGCQQFFAEKSFGACRRKRSQLLVEI